MARSSRPARLNRTLLLIIGIVLLAAAAFALLTAFGVLRVLARDASLTPATLTLPTWVTWASAVAAILLGLLSLRWLLAQALRQPKTGTWRLETDRDYGATELDAQTAVVPLVEEVESYPGVHRASARLSGTAQKPVLHLVIGTDDDADITGLRHRIDTQAMANLRRSLDLTTLPADLLIRLDDARSTQLT